MSKNWTLEAGYYRNSGRHTTKHFGPIYEPISLGSHVRLGVLAGYASGYVSKQKCDQYSGTFVIFEECYIPTFVPTVRVKFTEHWGANFYYIPLAGGVFGFQARYIFN